MTVIDVKLVDVVAAPGRASNINNLTAHELGLLTAKVAFTGAEYFRADRAWSRTRSPFNMPPWHIVDRYTDPDSMGWTRRIIAICGIGSSGKPTKAQDTVRHVHTYRGVESRPTRLCGNCIRIGRARAGRDGSD